MYNFTFLMEFSKRYASLGESVQEQLDDILDGNYEDVNPNAVKFIKGKLGGLNPELDSALNNWDVSMCEGKK